MTGANESRSAHTERPKEQAQREYSTNGVERTPGPWIVTPRRYEENNSVRHIVAGDYAGEGEPDLEITIISANADADAALIGAALDLMAACKMAEKVIGHLHVDEESYAAYSKLMDAIAKAEGREVCP